ncbi:MAG: sigma-54-dependent Fis family transcriptional regulator [Rhodospirillaceae bacterium]|nr:sigma-54-dependent Fis family transcriptional regulator [Rhodospirillaceae bacterium]
MTHDILVVDDEQDIRALICGILDDEGYRTRDVGDAEAALAAVRSRVPDLVILDVWLQGSTLDGLGVLEALMKEVPTLPVVMISGHGTIETAVTAIKHGAYDFVEKPFKFDRLLVMVERAVESGRLKRENAELRRRFLESAELVGSSTAMVSLRQQIERVAGTGSRVLITGPAGAGKEVAARQLHLTSKRARGPFVVLNCASMDPDQLSDELLGREPSHDDHEGGKVGALERAHGGTMLLDEVGDMPLETQAKIVRVLQEQAFTRVGGSQTIEVDVRVAATTNRDLKSLIEEGRFREDLYYRLNVVPIRVPSLAERQSDIPLLAHHFIEQATATQGLTRRAIGEDAMVALQRYGWPGNVRQLRNVIDWLLIMSTGDPITAEMLPAEIGAITPEVLKWDKGGEIMALPLRDARELFEREYLVAQVTRFGHNISRTAEFVGMERSALHRKLKSLGVTGTDRSLRVVAD